MNPVCQRRREKLYHNRGLCSRRIFKQTLPDAIKGDVANVNSVNFNTQTIQLDQYIKLNSMLRLVETLTTEIGKDRKTNHGIIIRYRKL